MKTYLYTILSSPNLIHLVLENVPLPEIREPPLPKLRQLTLRRWCGTPSNLWLLGWHLHSNTSSYKSAHFSFYTSCKLPSVPCLRELRHHQSHHCSTFPDESKLSELLWLGPHVTHLHSSGGFNQHRVTAFPKSLQHLSVEDWVLTTNVWN